MNTRIAYLPLLLLVVGVFIVIAAAVNWVVDPFRYYHSPWLDIGYSDNQRFQNPGLSRTEDYDIVLIGTSHTEPFITSEMDAALNARALNLSMSGALISEQSLLLELVLSEGKARRVLWEINYPSFAFGDGVAEPASFPFFLFQPGAETPFRYLLSWDTFLESLNAIRGERPDRLDHMHRWDLGATFSRKSVLAHWDFITTRWNDDLRDFWKYYAIPEAVIPDLVERHISRLVARYPDVQFDLLLLPSTLLDYASDLQVSDRRLDKRLLLRNEAAKVADAFGHVDIWDFQLVEWMTEDLQHYKDIDHFGQSIIRPILKSLASGEHRLPPREVVRNTKKLEHHIVRYAYAFCAADPDRCQAALLETLTAFRERNSVD